MIRKSYGLLHKRSIRFRFTISLFIMSISAIVLLSFLYYQNMKKFYEDKIESYQINLLTMMDSGISAIINNSKIAENQVLETLVTNNIPEDYAGETKEWRLNSLRKVENQLRNIKNSNYLIDNIYIIGTHEKGFCSNSITDPQIFREQPWVANPVEGSNNLLIPTHKAVYRQSDKESNSYLVVSRVAYLYQYKPKKTELIIQVDIAYSNIVEAMSCMDMTEEDYAVIVDESGFVIFSPNEDQIGINCDDDARLQSLFAGRIQGGVQRDDGCTIRYRAADQVSWTIIQVNSEKMLQKEIRNMLIFFSMTGMLLLGLSFITAVPLSGYVTKPIRKIVHSMEQVGEGDFNIKVEGSYDDELNMLVKSFNLMVDQVDGLMKEVLYKEKERHQIELQALHSQINSHFLYNTLNTIKWMAIRIGADEIARMVVALVQMLEYSSKGIDSFVPVEQELHFVKEYLHIQEKRTNSSIAVVFEIEEEVYKSRMLKMLLQPIVENSILHGFNGQKEDKRILISGSRQRDVLVFSIEDNGSGFHYYGIKQLTGIGITNVMERIMLNYGHKYGIEIQSEPGCGTVVSIRIPVVE